MFYALMVPGLFLGSVLWFWLCAGLGLHPLLGAVIVGLGVWFLLRYVDKKTINPSKSDDEPKPTTPPRTAVHDPFAFLQETIARLASEGCHPRDIDGIMHSFRDRHFEWSALLRNLQIWRESLTLAINSKNRETAESRMATAEEMFHESMTEHRRLMTDETKAGLTFVMKESRRIFHTETYINQALAHLEKAGQMKTAKAKAKYVCLATDAIERGLADPLSDTDRLESFKGTRFSH